MFEIDFFSQSPETIVQLASEKLRTADEEWEKQIWQFIIDWFNPAITSIKVFTSGSTGTPKQVTHTKSAMMNSAAATCTALQLKPGSRALLCLPVNKISGMMMVVRSIHNKMKLICIRPSSTPLQELTDEQQIDFAAFTPMQFHGVVTDINIFKKANQINKIILGGEDVRAGLLNPIQQLKSEVYITFGMTETISHIALKRLNGPKPDINFKVLTGIDISINDRNCLVISAPALGQSHLVTNDVVKLVGESEFQWLGRIDNVINSGGVKIQPEEIEQQLLNLIKYPYFIASVADKILGEKLVIALETPMLRPEEKNELVNAFTKLEKLHRPKLILLIPQFARTENGKIKRMESLLKPVETIDLSEKD
jgi:O-succinylbenzoic acid--CoA ligase